MHSLLERQLKKTSIQLTELPEELRRFIGLVDKVYEQTDEDRQRIERSMAINSRELLLRNEQIAAAERKYREIFDNVTEGICQYSVDNKYISANPAMARLCGYDDTEQFMAAIHDISTQIYADPQRHIRIINELKVHESIHNWESEIRRRDGGIVWISESTRAVQDSEGGLKYYEGVVVDIHARKTAELEREIQRKLTAAARQAGMAEIATGVLHNVGNVLNSINVSVSICTQRATASKLPGLARTVCMLQEHHADMAAFLTLDDKGRQIVDYLARLKDHLLQEQSDQLNELGTLTQNIDHIKQIVKSQQSYARTTVMHEKALVSELVDDAIRINQETLKRNGITVIREISAIPPVTVDKHQVLQILINLIGNAQQAMRSITEKRNLTITAMLCPDDLSHVIMQVADTGSGIKTEDLTRIFSLGFTTRSDGHGFGLHTSALAAQAMGGKLTAQSPGAGQGAVFTLEIPTTPDIQAQLAGKAA